VNRGSLAHIYDLSWRSSTGEEIKKYFVAGVGEENTSVGWSDPSACDPACLLSWTCTISAASQVNCSLVLTLEPSIIPCCVCTYLKIHNWSRIEWMLTVDLYLNKLNKAKSFEKSSYLSHDKQRDSQFFCSWHLCQ